MKLSTTAVGDHRKDTGHSLDSVIHPSKGKSHPTISGEAKYDNRKLFYFAYSLAAPMNTKRQPLGLHMLMGRMGMTLLVLWIISFWGGGRGEGAHIQSTFIFFVTAHWLHNPAR